MKKRRGKRLVAYIIAFAMIFSMGMTELSPIAEAAQYTILETDVRRHRQDVRCSGCMERIM